MPGLPSRGERIIHAHAQTHTYHMQTAENEVLAGLNAAQQPESRNMDGEDGSSVLDFDTEWSKFMNEQLQPVPDDPVYTSTTTPEESSSLLNPQESSAFTRFLDTLLLGPSSPRTARRIDEELQKLSSIVDSKTEPFGESIDGPDIHTNIQSSGHTQDETEAQFHTHQHVHDGQDGHDESHHLQTNRGSNGANSYHSNLSSSHNSRPSPQYSAGYQPTRHANPHANPQTNENSNSPEDQHKYLHSPQSTSSNIQNPHRSDNMSTRSIGDSTNSLGSGMTHGMAAGVVPGMASGMASGTIPGIVTGMVPGMSHGMSHGMAPGMVPGMAPGMVPGMAHGMAHGITPGMAPGMVPGMAPGIPYMPQYSHFSQQLLLGGSRLPVPNSSSTSSSSSPQAPPAAMPSAPAPPHIYGVPSVHVSQYPSYGPEYHPSFYSQEVRLQNPGVQKRRSSVTSDETRINHVNSEKKRRATIKSLFNRLQELVPSTELLPKSTVLYLVSQHIKKTQESNARIRKLLEENGIDTTGIERVMLEDGENTVEGENI